MLGGANTGDTMETWFGREEKTIAGGDPALMVYGFTISDVSRPLIVINSRVPVADRGLTLVHELLHVAYTRAQDADSHSGIWRGLGIAAPTNGQYSNWLKNGCK